MVPGDLHGCTHENMRGNLMVGLLFLSTLFTESAITSRACNTSEMGEANSRCMPLPSRRPLE